MLEEAPDVKTEGTTQTLLVTGLQAGVETYFALMTTDEVDQESGLSNIASTDDVAPAPITDLAVMSYDDASITFSFTATGDDGNNGAATAYDFRVAYGSEVLWDIAVPLTIDLVPGVAGSKQVVTVSELVYPSFALAFAMVALDNNGNASELSNIVAWRPNGIVPSSITEIVDIPEDQGYQARVTWTASDNEGDPGSLGVTSYGLWRMIEMPADAAANIVTGYIDLFNAAPTATAGDKFRVVNATAVLSEWDFVALVPAHADDMYNFVAPTLVNDANSTFMVSAHSAEGFVTNSAPVAGISVDNLAPSVVSGLAAVNTELNTVLLSWNENDHEYLDSDLSIYTVYRSEDMVNYESIGTTEVPELTDEAVVMGPTYYYKVTASDFSGNESADSDVATVVLLSVGSETAIPEVFSLNQNYPNPFNPTTAIEFALPEDAKVTLTIYNMLGQEIRLLANGDFQSGYHTVMWNGKDEFGLSVTSGMYLYRISAGDFSKTMKMVFLK